MMPRSLASMEGPISPSWRESKYYHHQSITWSARMTSHVVRVTSKGQATIPTDLRTKHGIRAPGLVRFVEAKGRLVVEPLATPAEMQGILKGKVRGKSLTELLL